MSSISWVSSNISQQGGSTPGFHSNQIIGLQNSSIA